MNLISEMKILIYSLVALAAFIAVASAQTAAPAVPSIGQFQSALSGLQTAAADLAAAWTALQPLLSVIASCAALAAALPHPSAGSIWMLPRKLLDFAGLNIGHAKNAEVVK
jgi:hypothetical protein